MKQVVLVGFMGAGKTTIGNRLAEKMNVKQADLDERIVQEIGMPISAYFDQFGEEAFRKIETQVLKDSQSVEGVLSTGGGIVLNEENQRLLQQMPLVVYLKAEIDTLIQRVTADTANVRPLATAKTPEEIKAVYLPRVPLYEASSTHTIDTTNRSVDDIVNEILDLVGE